MTRMFRPAFAVLALALASAPPAAAQAQQQQSPPPGQQAPSYSGDQLESYAEAVIKVQEINKSYAPKLEAAETMEQRQRVREEATEEMVEAIRAEGLSVETYNEIFSAAQADLRLMERVNRHVERAQ